MSTAQPRPVPPVRPEDIKAAEQRVIALNRALDDRDQAVEHGEVTDVLEVVGRLAELAPRSTEAVARFQGAPKGHL